MATESTRHGPGSAHHPPTDDEHLQQEAAAQTIQRNYRGYRERRQLAGMGLTAEARWEEAIKEARWRNTTRARSRHERQASDFSLSSGRSPSAASARQHWKRVGEIARRAGADDPEDDSKIEEDMSPEELQEYRRKRAEEKAEREKTAKILDLQYFLEMVDHKHRYGSNLRAYHDHWKKSGVDENFFYWLDHGAGKNFEHPTVSRERLEREQVRYLSREERQKYLVKVDLDGRLCWAKNGERINTTADYKDSVDGIVPKDDATPAYRSHGKAESSATPGSFRSSSDSSDSSDDEASHYVNQDMDKAKGMGKIKHVSAATILNHLLRGSVKPNSWIFVADTSFRLYLGIKQSGAFQHSSFLHGSRISAAGLMKIKDGRLERLSPLSGHYRPPTKNFRAFVNSLQDRGVDMSHVSISRSYAVLVGLEAYVKTRRKLKQGVQHVHSADIKLVHPEEHKRRVEEEKDKSKSAEKERQVLATEAAKEKAARKRQSWHRRVWSKVRGRSSTPDPSQEAKEHRWKKVLSKSGQDAESAIPPSGQLDRSAGGS